MVNTSRPLYNNRLLLVILLSLTVSSCATMKQSLGDLGLGGLVNQDTTTEKTEVEATPDSAEAATTDAAADAVEAVQDRSRVELVPLSEVHAEQAAQARRDFIRAIDTMRAGNNQEAMVLLQSITARFPLLSGPWVNQALIHFRLAEYGPAATKLHKAIALYPDHPYAHNLLGIAQRELGQFNASRSSYEKAIELDRNYAKAYYNLGVLADLYLQEFQLALESFQHYQDLQEQPDKQVRVWIKDLTRRAKAQAKVAKDNQLAQDSSNEGAE